MFKLKNFHAILPKKDTSNFNHKFIFETEFIMNTSYIIKIINTYSNYNIRENIIYLYTMSSTMKY